MALRVNPKEERQGKLYILKEPKSSKEKRKEYIEGRRRRQNKKTNKGERGQRIRKQKKAALCPIGIQYKSPMQRIRIQTAQLETSLEEFLVESVLHSGCKMLTSSK